MRLKSGQKLIDKLRHKEKNKKNIRIMNMGGGKCY